MPRLEIEPTIIDGQKYFQIYTYTKCKYFFEMYLKYSYNYFVELTSDNCNLNTEMYLSTSVVLSIDTLVPQAVCYCNLYACRFSAYSAAVVIIIQTRPAKLFH
jgi:hypothetical protein